MRRRGNFCGLVPEARCGSCVSPFLRYAAQGPERRPELGREELRLLPRREVPAFVDLVVVDELGIRLLGPAPRRLILLAWKDRHGYRDLDAFDVEKAALIFPI